MRILVHQKLEWMRKVVESNPENDRLYRGLIEKNEVHWKKLNSEDILSWLHNFENEHEVHCALVLADNILYYNLNDIHYLYKYILTNKVRIMLINEKLHSGLPSDLDYWFEKYLREHCIFLGFGRAGKSAGSMVYVFRQSHKIPGLTYYDLGQFLLKPGDLKSIERIFLIDDFLGSGKQALTEWRRKADEEDETSNNLESIKKNNPHINFNYLALVGCEVGKKNLESTLPIKVILGEELDDRFKCFSTNSVIFKDNKIRQEAKKVMEEKGRMLYSFPLGFDNMELAIVFNHNTPDNTLPVIWKNPANGCWFPLFERFE